MARRKGGSKFLAFLLGFIFAFILMVGVLVGGVALVLTYDFDSAFDFLSQVTGKDELKNTDGNGDYVFVNTDEASNVLELYNKLSTMTGNWKNVQEMTLEEFEKVLPVTDSLVNKLYESLKPYVEVDIDTLKQTKFIDLGAFLEQTIYNVCPANVLEKVKPGMADSNALLSLILFGTEAKYTSVAGVSFPLYANEYVLQDGQYLDVDNFPLINTFVPYLVPQLIKQTYENGDKFYLYGYAYEGLWAVAEKAEDGTYSATEVSFPYSQEQTTLSGHYYLENGERVVEKNITLGSFASGNLVDIYGQARILDLLSGVGMQDELINTLFADVTLADLFAPNGVTNALYDVKLLDMIKSDNQTINSIFKDVTLGMLIENPDEFMNNVTAGSLLDIPADNAFLTYLAYGLSNVHAADENLEYDFIATYTTVDNVEIDAYIVEDESGYLKEAYIYENGEKVILKGIPILEISTRLDDVTHTLTIRDLVGSSIPHNKLIDAIGHLTIAEIDTEHIFIADLLDIEADNAIVMYLAYGVEHLTTTPNVNGRPVVITADALGMVQSVTYVDDGSEVAKTTVSGINGRIDGVVSKLTIREIMGDSFDENNRLMVAIGDKTVGEIDANAISIADVMDIHADNAIILYLAYGIRDEGGVKYVGDREITMLQEGGLVTSVTYVDDGTPVAATSVSGISSMVDGVLENLTIRQVMGSSFDENNKLMAAVGDMTIGNISAANIRVSDVADVKVTDTVMTYLAYGVVGVKQENGVYTGTYIDDEGNEHLVTITVDGNDIITDVVDENGVHDPAITIDKVGERANHVTQSLTLGDLMQLTPEDKMLWSLRDYKINEVSDKISTVVSLADIMDIKVTDKIMSYLAFGITNIQGSGTAYTGTVEGQAVTITTNTQKIIVGVEYTATGEKVEAIKVGQVSERTAGIMDNLTLGDLCDIDSSNSILYAIKDNKINEISTAVSKLTIQQLYYNEIYGKSAVELAVTYNAEYIYYNADGTLAGVNGKLDAATFNSGTYYTYGEAKGIWSFLLKDSSGIEQIAYIENLTTIMSNATTNIPNATLYELAEAGLISATQAELSKTLLVPGVGSVVLGECVLQKLIEMVIDMAV